MTDKLNQLRHITISKHSLETRSTAGYDLVVGENTNYSISKNIILVSRNRPIGLVVGVAGFIGSRLAEHLLEKGIQVIGIDNFSIGRKENLNEVIKSKNFHLTNESITDFLPFKLPRLDYAFFCAENKKDKLLYSKGLKNFLEFINRLQEQTEKDIQKQPTRIIFLSSIELYDNKLGESQKELRTAEIKFARFIKYYKLNARIIRLAPVFGPKMNFNNNDPITELIYASLSGSLQEEQTALNFSTRAVYIDDCVNLILKSAFLGSTSHKIFDCAQIQPIKISEIKQILMDPVWHDLKRFEPTQLPPWSTPNLEKTMKSLNWSPEVGIIEALKKTIAYFKDNNIQIEEPKSDDAEEFITQKNWSMASTNEQEPELSDKKETQSRSKLSAVFRKKIFYSKKSFAYSKKSFAYSKKSFAYSKKSFAYFLATVLIFYALLFPIIQVISSSLSIRSNLKLTQQAIEKGDFRQAEEKIDRSKLALDQVTQILSYLEIMKRLGILENEIINTEQVLSTTKEGILGVDHAISGIEALFQATKIISGEVNSDPTDLYKKAQTELTEAEKRLAKIQARLSDNKFLSLQPEFIKIRAKDLVVKLVFYTNLVEKGRAASFILPKVTGVDGLPAGQAGKKSYLVLLQNNLELRPGGGFIGSYAKLDFERGKIQSIKVDDIYNLDGSLRDVIEPPEEIRNDLGQNRLYLRDSNFEPDFPTSARQAEFFYKKESGELINGVFALNLSASAKLLDAVGGIDLPDYNEHINGSNLFEKSIIHAEVNFFPGSQAKKNYLTSLQNQLFNKIFFLSKQNWPEIIRALDSSLEQKQLLLYFADPELFSYLVSENWAGVMPRGVVQKDEGFSDFLMPVEANYGANKSNYYIERKYKLDTLFGKEGQIEHKFLITYKNNSPSEVFPAGTYKNRFKVYLPLGSKINKITFGQQDILKEVKSFSDYGRSVYSVLIKIAPQEEKILTIEYTVFGEIKFKSGEKDSFYRIDVLKQSGTSQDPFEWRLTYPINYKINPSSDYKLSGQELQISSDLSTDRSFQVNIQKD